MTGWLILLCILGLLAVVLFVPAVLHVTLQAEQTDVRLSFLGIPIYRSDRQRKRKKTKKKPSKKKKESSSKGKKKEKQPLSEKLDLIKDALSGVRKGLRKLTRGIRFRHVSISVAVGSFDACECAMAYGKMNAALYPCLAVLGTVFSVSYDDVAVHCCFGEPKTRYRISGTVKLSLACVLSALLAFGLSFLWNTLERKKESESTNTPQAAAEKEPVSHKK